MNFILSYIVFPFINWGQLIFCLVIIFIVANKRFASMSTSYSSSFFGYFSKFLNLLKNKTNGISYKSLILSVLGFKAIYALVETVSQYYVWSGNALTKSFLNQNIVDLNVIKDFPASMAWIFDNRLGYFLFYSWGRFWFEIVISLVAGLVFYLFLIFLKKHKERFFEEGEVEMGFILSLLVGWSNFTIFLPLVFLSVILVSITKLFLFFIGRGSVSGVKEIYTTLGAPLLLAALIVLFFGNYLVSLFGLMPLRI